MPAPTKAFTAPLTLKDDAAPGAVQAVFSTFNVIDKQGDVVLPGAFTPGVAVPLIWAHEWETMPVGKGTVEVQADRAVFVGAFHLQTQFSRDAYETVKAMGDLQEYSYGFDIDVAEPGEWEGQPARLIHKFGRIYEVSPVLVGAGERTGTLAIKAVQELPPPEPPDPLTTSLTLLQTVLASEAKDGRVLAERNWMRVQQAADLLQQVMDDAAREPLPSDAGKARRARAEFVRLQARLAGALS